MRSVREHIIYVEKGYCERCGRGRRGNIYMLRKCKTVIAAVVITVMMFSVLSYAESTGKSVSETGEGDAGASVQQQAAASDDAGISAGIIDTANENNANEADDKVITARSSYMCFIGTSAALATRTGAREFTSACFRPTFVKQMKIARDDFNANKLKPLITSQPATADGNVPDPSKPMVALTFDDGPYGPVTNRILAKLEENGGRATFFVVGNRVKTYASSVQRAVKDGCQIGNHTYDHKNPLTKLTTVQIQKQIHDTDVAVAYYAGSAPVIARPVGGAVNDTVKAAAGKPLINWSIDTLDWKSKNAASVQSKVLDHVKDGDIILMHDLYKSTADACDVIIPELTKRGYQLVTVSELAAAKGVALKNGKLYTSM